MIKELFGWIVHEWGGISGGKNNIEKLLKIGLDAINEPNLKFDRIASTSKILSFYNPDKYVIYDARIAYSLNAIMLIEGASNMFFPIPLGKNSKMNAFDVEVLVRLKNKENNYKRLGKRNVISNGDKNLFIPQKQAYTVLNKLVLELNSEIYKDDLIRKNYPFYTEMLLFGIADNVIFDMILNSVQIDFNKKIVLKNHF